MVSQEAIIYSSITEIPAAQWDAILDPIDIFHTHRFIHTVELAQIENSQCWPICFYENGELVASTVLSAFRVDLGIFLEEAMRRWIQRMRRRFPNFLQPRILFCGLPISLGQDNLIIARAEATDWVLKALDEKMDEIAVQHGLKYLALKEFDRERTRQLAGLEHLGYFIGDSIPYMNMDIRWPSFDAYMQELKHTYRRQIRKSLQKVPPFSSEAEIRLNHWEACSPDLFYEYYLRVMARTETKLETLNLAFFEHCFERLKDDMSLITVEKEDEVLSAGILFHHAPYLTFALVGNKYEKYPEADPYFNLMYAMIDLATKEQVQQLKLGQTAYWVKQRLGGQPDERLLFFKAKNRLMHFVLKSLRSLLFPTTHIPAIHVFKQASA